MLSPAQRHSARIKAEKQLSECQVLDAGHSLHVKLRALEHDVGRVRSLDVTSDRVAMKRRELLPRWLPTAQAYLDNGEVHQNPILVYCIIWLFDVDEFDQALDWADIAIEQGQKMPGDFRSKLPAFVADTVMKWAEIAAASGESVEPYFSRTFKNIREKWRLHEEINAKWYKFAGLLLLRDNDGQPRATALDDVALLQQADALLAQAVGFHRQIGVTTLRRNIAARIRALLKE